MSNKIYYSKTALTGGAVTALDYIDGSLLSDGDLAYVNISGVVYTYKLSASSGASESSPDVISPDTNAGTKRWILQSIEAGGHGQCRLSISSTNLLLSRYNGRYLIINGKPEVIPSAGITLAPTSLSASTTYNIYAYMNSGTMTLEASATAHATDSTTGVEIKSGDATRTLVGMARTTAATAWADSATQRLVLSWFNRKNKSGKNNYSVQRSTTTTSYAELSAEIRIEFLTWSDEDVHASVTGNMVVTSASAQGGAVAVAIDSTSAAQAGLESMVAYGSSLAVGPNGIAGKVSGLAEGYHYATILGASTDGTAVPNWFPSTSISGFQMQTALHIGIRG